MKDVIKLRISVERETQKGILIGAGGAALKSLMTASRKAVEEFLERRGTSGEPTDPGVSSVLPCAAPSPPARIAE